MNETQNEEYIFSIKITYFYKGYLVSYSKRVGMFSFHPSIFLCVLMHRTNKIIKVIVISLGLTIEVSSPDLKKSIKDFKASGVVQRLLFLAASLLSTVLTNGVKSVFKVWFKFFHSYDYTQNLLTVLEWIWIKSKTITSWKVTGKRFKIVTN